MIIVSKVKAYNLDLNKITPKATQKLYDLDKEFVGTPDYMGLAYFWAYEYRHLLRDNRKYWINIHKAFLDAGLDVREESYYHLQIINKIIKRCRCSIRHCECVGTRMDSGMPQEEWHCYKCPTSISLIGGGLECYGIYEGRQDYDESEAWKQERMAKEDK
jgi:hypothetical protein